VGEVTATPDGALPGVRLGVDVSPAGPWLVVELSGELDAATVPELIDQVGRLLAQERTPRIALELSRVTFCDSSGINAFIRLWKRTGADGGELVLLRPAPRMTELLTRTGVDGFVRVRETLPPGGFESGPGPEPV
jgi:anti-sigma B factor antagonist